MIGLKHNDGTRWAIEYAIVRSAWIRESDLNRERLRTSFTSALGKQYLCAHLSHKTYDTWYSEVFKKMKHTPVT
jgi:hypothetical protein